MKVYAAVSYDDGVRAVFSTEELAVRAVEKLLYGDTIEEFEVDGLAGRIGSGERYYEVLIDESGDNYVSRQESPPIPDRDRPDHWATAWGKYFLRVRTWARDENHAIEIADDRRLLYHEQEIEWGDSNAIYAYQKEQGLE